MVAIPSVLFYNSLATRADRIHQGLSVSAGQFIDHLELKSSATHRTPRGGLERRPQSRVEGKHDDLHHRRSRFLTRSRGTSSVPEINVTPLVDVVLVLLIIFMVIAPQLEAGERVELPHADQRRQGGQARHHDRDDHRVGRLLLEKDEKTEEALKAELRALHEKEPERRVVIKCDRGVKYGKVRTMFASRAGHWLPGRRADGRRAQVRRKGGELTWR